MQPITEQLCSKLSLEVPLAVLWFNDQDWLTSAATYSISVEIWVLTLYIVSTFKKSFYNSMPPFKNLENYVLFERAIYSVNGSVRKTGNQAVHDHFPVALEIPFNHFYTP